MAGSQYARTKAYKGKDGQMWEIHYKEEDNVEEEEIDSSPAPTHVPDEGTSFRGSRSDLSEKTSALRRLAGGGGNVVMFERNRMNESGTAEETAVLIGDGE